MARAVISILAGLGVSMIFGGGWLFVGLLTFAFFFPSLFKFGWYLLMFPLAVGAFALGAWLFLPMLGVGGWNSEFYKMLLIPAVLPAIWFCSPSGMGPA